MRKLILSALGATIFSIPALAIDKGNVGCGLGYVLLKNQPNTVLFNVLAVTTNGTSANQTFGITSGTLECRPTSGLVKNDRLFKFVSKNMDSLASDIASGEGEALETVVELMNIPEDKKAIFISKLQENFDNIYSSEKVQSSDVVEKLAEIAKEV